MFILFVVSLAKYIMDRMIRLDLVGVVPTGVGGIALVGVLVGCGELGHTTRASKTGVLTRRVVHGIGGLRASLIEPQTI